MKYNYFPNTGLKVSRISLGTMMFGGQTSEADSIDIIHCALDGGINFIDTADQYNRGASEIAVGKALAGRRDSVILATKVCNPMSDDMNDQGLSRRHIISACEASLRRLGTDYIDIYYMHKPDYNTPIEESLEAMTQLVRDGKVRYIGISNYASWQAADILWTAELRGLIKPVVTQNVYNLLTRGIEEELLPFCREHKIGLTVYNPIAAGLLAGKHKYGDRPTPDTRFALNKTYADRYWNEKNFQALDSFIKLAEDCGMPILEFAMKWVDACPLVTSIISGVSRKEQLVQNMSILEDVSSGTVSVGAGSGTGSGAVSSGASASVVGGHGPIPADAMARAAEIYADLTGSRFKYNR